MRTSTITALLLALTLPGCESKTTVTPATSETRKITITGWIRLPARPDLPASGYFDAAAEGKVGPLESVTLENARVEMHESMAHQGMASMKPIGPTDFVDGRMTFAPGGKHLMIYGLPAGLKPGTTLPLVFHF